MSDADEDEVGADEAERKKNDANHSEIEGGVASNCKGVGANRRKASANCAHDSD